MSGDDASGAMWTATKHNAMTDSEMVEFLAAPLIARLASHRSDGLIHLTPVWFLFEDGCFFFTLGERRLHLRNLKRDPRATLLVDVDRRPEQGVAGPVRAVMCAGLVETHADPEIVALYGGRIDARYVGGASASTAVEIPTIETYELVVLTPTTTVTWDFSKA